MASTDGAKWSLWRDYSRRPIDQYQILATDFWSQWMTAFVAVCLTLTSPYVFKISRSFLIWICITLATAAKAWSSAHGFESVERQHLLASDDEVVAQPSATEQPADASNKSSSRKHADPPPAQSIPTSESLDTTSNDSGRSAGTSPPTAATVQITQSRPKPALEPSTRGSQNPAIDDLLESSDSRDTVWHYVKPLLQRGAREFRAPSKTMIVIATVLFGLFIAQAVAGVFSTKIVSDRAGLSSSQRCGIWQYDDDAGEDEAYRQDLLNNHNKEARASQYARTCYDSGDSSAPFSCNMFYNQSIAYKTLTNQRCPFASPDMCLEGLYSAITFDTGLVDATIIGINAPSTHKLRRKTTCSPLNMSEPYVQSVSSSTNETYHYHYGSKKDGTAYTFDTSGRPFQWLAPVYSVNTYFSSLDPGDDYWQPLPSLRPPADSTLTIIFVSSMHIYHTKPNLDPIFHATEPRYFDGYRDPYYYNSDPRARVLACVDETKLCSPDGKTPARTTFDPPGMAVLSPDSSRGVGVSDIDLTSKSCWPVTAPASGDNPSPPDYWLTKWSLRSSNIYDSLKFRLGTALLAQESISQSVSLPLGSKHWQSEASQLFATSLARIQYDAWDMAIGADREKPGYVEVTPDEAKGRLCRIVKMKRENYTNVNLLAFIGLPCLAFTIFILSWDVRTFPGVKAPKGVMVVDVIARWLVNISAKLLVGVCRLIALFLRSAIDFSKKTILGKTRGSQETGHASNGDGNDASAFV